MLPVFIELTYPDGEIFHLNVTNNISKMEIELNHTLIYLRTEVENSIVRVKQTPSEIMARIRGAE